MELLSESGDADLPLNDLSVVCDARLTCSSPTASKLVLTGNAPFATYASELQAVMFTPKDDTPTPITVRVQGLFRLAKRACTRVRGLGVGAA